MKKDEMLLGFALPERRLRLERLRPLLPGLIERLQRALEDDEELEQLALYLDLQGFTDEQLDEVAARQKT